MTDDVSVNHGLSDGHAALRATLRFHAAAGTRVALRNSVLGTMGAVFVMGSAPRPPGLFRPLSLGVAGAESSPWSLVIVAMVGLALARQAAPQLAAGHAGWLRSLAATRATHRRALAGALFLAQAPLMLFLICACGVVLLAPQSHLSFPKLAASLLIMLGAAMHAAPANRRGASSLVSLLALAAATTASTVGLAGALALLVLADRVGDAVAAAPRRRRTPLLSAATLLPYRIAWRAVGWQALVALIPAALPLGFAWLMCDNNGMTGEESATVMRTAGTIAVVMALASLASVLQLRRPAWAWARSLPASASGRVRQDALALLVPLVPVWLAVALVHPLAGIAVMSVSPLVALVAAAAMRRSSTRITGTQGEVWALGTAIVVAVGFSWWTTLAVVALTPAALHLAARRDRALSPTQWNERHHSTAGDALAWTAR